MKPIRKRSALLCGLACLVLGWIPLSATALPDLSTPRRSMKGYLEACRAGHYALAAKFLELGGKPSETRDRGRGEGLARRLKVVLDQTLWVDLGALSDAPDGHTDDNLPSGVDRVGSVVSKHGPVEILLRHRGNRWQISRRTLEHLPLLYKEYGYGRLRETLPSSFFQRFGELQLWQWLGLIAVFLLAYGVGLFLTSITLRVAQRLVARTETTLDDRLLALTSGPLSGALAIALFYAGSLVLRLSVPARRVVTQLGQALVVVMVTWLALRLIDLVAGLIEDRFSRRGEATAITVIPIGRRISKVFLLMIAVLSALQNLGYNITGLIAGLGVGGLAVALAAQKTFENFFGAMALLVDQPIKRGDFCRFGDKLGIIEDIGLRSTRVRTLDRTVITVPNAEFSALQIENFALRDQIRFYTVIGLRYETSADQLRHVLIELRRFLLSHPQVSPDPARVRFVGFGASSLDLEIYAFVTTSDWAEFLAVREDLLLRMISIVEASGTGFAFPSQTLYLGKDEGLDSARAREAEQQVRAWRGKDQLNLPDFPRDEQTELRASLLYPDAGSSMARPQRATGDDE